MPNGMPDITPAELRIMKVIWRLGAGTVRDVRDALVRDGGDAPAYTTVMTLMNQLAAKCALHVDRERQPFVYRPAVRREKVLGYRLQQFLNTVFDGQAGELVLRLVEEADLSPEDLKRIEARIEQREQSERGGSPESREEPS
ncbi:MAG: BlaI/MecI/CopY family transcriptional regulator [Phycisphaerae bacterium]|nr:BlaI/MecI/CopY family transcriptional regulator [Phycisphaerae bacterium]NUQ46621.1 BlaI/MecI/CopY family transcriptional regulator [Phycisphaerae bacterium]